MKTPVIFAAVLATVAAVAAESDVVINEIMYHPPLDMEELQYVELYNRGKTEVDLSHWSFAKGIKLTFPEKTRIPAGGYLVVCRNVQVFEANYKGATAVGDYTGKLSHRGERIELHDAK